MKFSRRIPRFSSFKVTALTIFGLFLIAHFIDFGFIKAFAPVVLAKVPRRGGKELIPADVPTSGDENLDEIIFRAGEETGVDPRLIHAVIWQESHYNPNAKSAVGALGLMQMMPATAKRFNCRNTANEQENVEAGTRYLRWLLERFDGDVALTLAAYNAGEGSVDKYNGVPPFGQTQTYVRNIVARYGKTYHPLLSPEQARIEFHLAEEIAKN